MVLPCIFVFFVFFVFFCIFFVYVFVYFLYFLLFSYVFSKPGMPDPDLSCSLDLEVLVGLRNLSRIFLELTSTLGFFHEIYRFLIVLLGCPFPPQKKTYASFSYLFASGSENCLFFYLNIGFLVKNSRIPKFGPNMTTKKRGSILSL